MTDQEVEACEGWINEVTNHAAMVLFNDQQMLKKVQRRMEDADCLPSGMVTTMFKGLIPDRLENYRTDIDTFSLQHMVLTEMHQNGLISQTGFKQAEHDLENSPSNTKRRKRLIQKLCGCYQDLYWDHYNYMKGKAAMRDQLSNKPEVLGGFKIGDRVKYYKLDHNDRPMKATVTDYVFINENWLLDMLFDKYGQQAYEPSSIRHLSPAELEEEIKEHITAANESMDRIEAALSPKEAIIMKVETKHFVNGQEVNTYDADSQAALILNTEKEIEKLKAVKTPTKAIAAKINELEKFLTDAVETFNKAEA